VSGRQGHPAGQRSLASIVAFAIAPYYDRNPANRPDRPGPGVGLPM